VDTSIKVLFIMGKGRSGSTLLDNALGEIDGFFSAGEIHNLWRRGLVNGFKCGCGRSVPTCPVWSEVLAAMPNTADPRQVLAWQAEVVRSRNGRRLVRLSPGASATWPALERYCDVLSSLYRAIAGVTGDGVIVDSSKRAVHGALLRLVPGISPYFVHLVRDPRAVGFSRQRTRYQGDREMRRDSALYSAVTWTWENALAEIVRRRYPAGRALVVRYEDFVARPRQTVQEILAMVGEAASELPFADDHVLTLGVNHSAAGNPSRFRRGTVALREDDEWRTRQRRIDRLVTTGLTLPLLLRYGYRIRTRSTASRGPLVEQGR
jgi:hypothetical protein